MMTLIDDKITAVDLDLVVLTKTDKSIKSHTAFTEKDLEYQENRRKRKVRKLNFEINGYCNHSDLLRLQSLRSHNQNQTNRPMFHVERSIHFNQFDGVLKLKHILSKKLTIFITSY